MTVYTTPNPYRTQSDTGGRTYVSRKTGAAYPSVTTILDVIHSPALLYWGPKAAAEYAVANWQALSGLPPTERAAEIKGAPWKQRDEAAEIGSAAHACIEKYVLGEDVPDYTDSEIAPRMVQFARFEEEYKPEWIAAEMTVFNDKWGYAGTLDGIARIPQLGGVCILDVKTGNGVYEKAGMQLNAYAYAEWAEVGDNDSVLRMKLPDAAFVLHLQKTQYRIIPVTLSDEMFQSFTVARRLVDLMAAVKQNALGEPIVSKETLEEKHARRQLAV